MQLIWNWDPEVKMATAIVNSSLQYKSPDGGQTIMKYVDGNLVNTFHKYGPDNKFAEFSASGMHTDLGPNTWGDEVVWLSQNYADILGPFMGYYDQGFRNRDGGLDDVGKMRGFGVNNPSDKISVNRMLAPANLTEWWDWDTIAITAVDGHPDCQGRGMVWRKNYKTGEIVRVSAGNPPYPCCCFPTIYGPYPVAEEDLEADVHLYEGRYL